ncbi:xyloglucan endotransglucosylase/hydrolase protein 24-like [Phragmites australis]|uniref:xyloglucan endotransglucosylase/hydrolase protein 24-like n=1 Tax=Phragmites australis TaxID=29695 RepID=UPI002D797FF9|nr:xyloglucan endotransglucosylase/hydrolase protein 24-like [Phragmites australis]
MVLFPSSCMHCMLVVALLVMAMAAPRAVALLYDDIEQTWGADHSFFYMDGDVDTLALCLDETHGSGFQTKDAYLYGRFDIDMMLIANNSAGTVTTVYLMPDEVPWEYHDEVDLEFLGNVTGEPYTLHTNIFVNGVGRREQQFRLWFDPTADFHTYSIVWNPKHVLILIDGVPVRDYKNDAARGVPFPTWQRMRLYGTLWNADDWATQGGRVKTDWTQAPFYAYYRNLRVTPCVPSPGVAWCGDEPPESVLFEQALDASALQRAREDHMIYDYCRDHNRFKDKGLPKECTTD